MHPIPVLTYHATNVDGNDYDNNDHVALAHDLEILRESGFTVVPLGSVVDALIAGGSLPAKSVALTFDDGTDFDYRDLVHPKHGLQRSMFNIMRESARKSPNGYAMHATTFVIASPAAREQMDRGCLVGAGWFNDDWWRPAVESGLFGVGNHSWDHNHPVVAETARRRATGTFGCVDDFTLADLEIRKAHDYIESVAPNPASALFAYPYGESNEYLTCEYFPRGESVTGTRAAFGTEPAHVTRGANRWNLPRYVCGAHWRTPDELQRILSRRA